MTGSAPAGGQRNTEAEAVQAAVAPVAPAPSPLAVASSAVGASGQLSFGGGLSVGPLIALQRAAGNVAVSRALAGRSPGRVLARNGPDPPAGGAATAEPASSEWFNPGIQSAPTHLARARAFIRVLATQANRPELMQTTHYYIVTDRLYVFGPSGAQPAGTFPLRPGSRTMNPGVYASDVSVGVWQRYGRPLNPPGPWSFYPYLFDDPEAARRQEMSSWLRPGDLERVNALTAGAISHLLVVSDFSPEEEGSGGDGEGEGTAPAGPPSWARSQVERANRQLAQDRARAAQAQASGDGRTTLTPSQNAPADRVVPFTTPNGDFANVWADGAHRALEMREGESLEDFMRRVQAAAEELRRSRDPSQSTAMAGGATETGIQAGDPRREGPASAAGGGFGSPDAPAGGGTGPRPNAPAYPARIINHGADQTVVGATNHFEMSLDFGISGGSFDQTFARLQPINYHWELIDVTGVPQAGQREAARHRTGTRQTHSGLANDMARSQAEIAEDARADLETASRIPPIAWPVRSAYLGLTAVGTLVREIGIGVSAVSTIVSEPINGRAIGFDREGEYIIRCSATPVQSDRVPPEQRVIRASSIAVVPIRVTNVNRRAVEANQADLDELSRLEQDARHPPPGRTVAEQQAILADRRRRQGMNTAQLIGASIEDAEKSLRDLDAIEQAHRTGREITNLDQSELDLHLTMQRISYAQYRESVTRLRDSLRATQARANAYGMRGMQGRVYRPRITLASEENGQVTQMLTNLGQATESTDARPVWQLIDVTSQATRDIYTGTGSTHAEAIRNAFVRFRENNGYGRGTIAIRLPADLEADIGNVPMEAMMRSAPGDRARVMNRLRDLAAAAAVAGLVLSGGAGLAIGAIGGIAGAVVAIDNQMRRADTGRLALDMETFNDVLAVVGAVASIAQLRQASMASRASRGAQAATAARDGTALARAEQLAARARRLENFLFVTTAAQTGIQALQIPYSLVVQLGEIAEQERRDALLPENERTPPGVLAARRVNAFRDALYNGLITAVSVQQMMESRQQQRAGGGADEANSQQRIDPPSGDPPAAQGADVPPPARPAQEGPAAHDPAAPRDPAAASGGPNGRPPAAADGAPTGGNRQADPMEPTIGTFDNPRPIDVRRLAQAVSQSLGAPGEAPLAGRIRIVPHDLVVVLWEHANPGTAPPADAVGIRNESGNILYVSADRYTPAMHERVIGQIENRVARRARTNLGEPLVQAWTEAAVATAVHGAPELPLASEGGRIVFDALRRAVGADLIDAAVTGNEMGPLRARLSAVYGPARARAIETAMRTPGRGGDALMLLDPPNPALSDAFGPLLANGAMDLMTRELGGTPRDAARADVAQAVADAVGRDVLRQALLEGDTAGLRSALERALGPERAAELAGALQSGNARAARNVLRGGAASAAPAARPAEGAAERPTPRPAEAAAAHGHDAPPAVREAGPAALALRDALAGRGRPEALRAQAEATIREVGDFRMLRRMVREAGVFGTTDSARRTAEQALQHARDQIVNGVFEQVVRELQAAHPDLVVTRGEPGTPGFGSDRDITVKVGGANGDPPPAAAAREAVGASVRGVRRAYELLEGMGLPADRLLDTNFYSELHEGLIPPASAAERSAISADQSVVSLAEMRRNMSAEQWNAYREQQLAPFAGPRRGLQGEIEGAARSRLEHQFAEAQALAERLGPPEQREQMLNQRQQELLEALAETPPASAQRIRQLMAEIKLLEPDAYGTRGAVEGVVDTQQGLARAEDQGRVGEIAGRRAERMRGLPESERVALLTQEASASAGKLLHSHGPAGNGPAQAISASKYLGRIWHAFREAGLNLRHPLVDRTGEVVASKQESVEATMNALRAWAEDANLGRLDDGALIDEYVRQADQLGLELVSRMRTIEATRGAQEQIFAPTPTAPAGGTRGDAYALGSAPQLRSQDVNVAVRQLGRGLPGGGRAVPQSGPNYTVEIPAEGSRPAVRADVSVQARAGGLTPSSHRTSTGADAGGPARMIPQPPTTAGGRWRVTIEVDARMAPDDVVHALRHETTELARLMIEDPGGTGDLAARTASMQPGVFQDGAPVNAPATAHDHGSAAELASMLGARDSAKQQHESLNTPQSRAALDRADDMIGRQLREMGLLGADLTVTQRRLMRLRDMIPQGDAWIAKTQEAIAAQYRRGLLGSEGAAGRTVTAFADPSQVAHQLFPRTGSPHVRAPGGPVQNPPNKFLNSGVEGGHITGPLLDLAASHPNLHLKPAGQRDAAGTTWHRYEQWWWIGEGAKGGPSGDNLPGRAGFNPADWRQASQYKTTCDDPVIYLQEAESAWRTLSTDPAREQLRSDGSSTGQRVFGIGLPLTTPRTGGVGAVIEREHQRPRHSANGVPFGGFTTNPTSGSPELRSIFPEAEWFR